MMLGTVNGDTVNKNTVDIAREAASQSRARCEACWLYWILRIAGGTIFVVGLGILIWKITTWV
jgi:hypothetical protein